MYFFDIQAPKERYTALYFEKSCLLAIRIQILPIPSIYQNFPHNIKDRSGAWMVPHLVPLLRALLGLEQDNKKLHIYSFLK